MHVKAVVSLFNTDKLEETKAFYSDQLGFRVYFEKPGCFVGLRCATNEAAEITFMNPPPGMGPLAKADGLMYCLQVDGVDAQCERLRSEGGRDRR